ncbi:unnamed protein product [Thlaspi arvense]|uniref:Pentatricopeptide repeat-containing protein n=1 Tax=Thlaspi arvense TaxID=13288 RepID=A0AAU9RGA3_THLAR|nr:unnamed protein product [Thlaspi arvense]
MLCGSFSSFSLSLEDALHLLQRFFDSSNKIKQIHCVLFTSNALVASRWKTIFVYNTLIRSYLTTGQYQTSLALFTHMLASQATFVSVLSSCANLDHGGVRLGKQIHGYVMTKEIIITTTFGTALLDMYGKAGDLEMALTTFDQIRDKKVCAWNAIISALASNGKPKEALEMFEVMKSRNVHPNGITLLAVLMACARSKLVDLGIQLFTSMCREYKITPTSEHYGCMVDLIGRAGLLVDAVEFIKNLPFEPDACVLGALLGACKIHEDVELGNKVGKMLIGLQPQHCGQYVALSTLSALESNWAEAEEIRKVMVQAGIRKIPAYSVLSGLEK